MPIDLTQLEHSEKIARWVELSEFQKAQIAPNESKRSDGRGHRPESGVQAASRELGINKDDAHRSVKVASITERAKEAARQTATLWFLDNLTRNLFDLCKLCDWCKITPIELRLFGLVFSQSKEVGIPEFIRANYRVSKGHNEELPATTYCDRLDR